jgi:hypothetical protein
LLDNMRAGVISRMFTYRPRNLGSQASAPSRELPAETQEEEPELATVAEAESETDEAPDQGGNQDGGGGKKRRRRRRH